LLTRTLALCACLFLTAPSFAQFDPGGNLFWYQINNFDNTTPITGICLSACTVRLDSARCVDRNAQLGFHEAKVHGVKSESGTLLVAYPYKPALRRWFLEGNLSVLRVLRGSQLARFGYKVC